MNLTSSVLVIVFRSIFGVKLPFLVVRLQVFNQVAMEMAMRGYVSTPPTVIQYNSPYNIPHTVLISTVAMGLSPCAIFLYFLPTVVLQVSLVVRSVFIFLCCTGVYLVIGCTSSFDV
jgi:hypothetical protein